MCTGNSCRSIIAEALINARLAGVRAYSCGVAPSGRVNPYARRVLEAHDIWEDRYHSKDLDAVIDVPFDLVVTVCDHARETCPTFPYPIPKIHVGFDDPDGQPYTAFEETYAQIEAVLLREVERELGVRI